MQVCEQLIAAMKPGSLIVVHSTVSPATCRELDLQAQKVGLRVIDAPVSGGNAAAREGKLTLVVGADMASFESCREYFSAFASLVLRLGEVGSGQVAKLINNALMVANMGLAHQALELGAALHVDHASLSKYLAAGSGRSFSLDIYCSLPSLAVFAQHGARLLEKDLGLLRELAVSSAASDVALTGPGQNFLNYVRAFANPPPAPA